MSRLTGVSQRAATLGEFFGYLWRRKLLWMIPMLAVILAFGLILVIGQASPLAPLIYSLF
jgi:hypothetical protein